MVKRARLTGAEERHENEEQHRYIISEEKRETVDDIILRLLSMDARTPLSEIAKEAKVSKTTIFHELNRLITEQDIHFIPEINLIEMWQRELVHKTKRTEKREFRKLPIKGIGFDEFICFISFPKSKPTAEQILKSVEKARNSYGAQYIGKILEGKYDLIMYAVFRNTTELTDFFYDFQKNLPLGCEAYRYALQIKRVHGYFPLNEKLINQFKISDRYKSMLQILNQNARGELSKMGMKKDMVTYLYRALLSYGIMDRATLYIRKPKQNLIGIIRFDELDTQKWTKNGDAWYKKVVTQSFENGTYILTADVYNPFGAILIVNAKDPSEFERIKGSIDEKQLGVKLRKSMLISESILGNLGIRNFDMRYSYRYKYLEQKGLVPKVSRKEEAKIKKQRTPEFFELELGS